MNKLREKTTPRIARGSPVRVKDMGLSEQFCKSYLNSLDNFVLIFVLFS